MSVLCELCQTVQVHTNALEALRVAVRSYAASYADLKALYTTKNCSLNINFMRREGKVRKREQELPKVKGALVLVKIH